MKKLVSLVLAVAMVLSLGVFSVSATEVLRVDFVAEVDGEGLAGVGFILYRDGLRVYTVITGADGTAHVYVGYPDELYTLVVVAPEGYVQHPEPTGEFTFVPNDGLLDTFVFVALEVEEVAEEVEEVEEDEDYEEEYANGEEEYVYEDKYYDEAEEYVPAVVIQPVVTAEPTLAPLREGFPFRLFSFFIAW